MLYSNSVRSAGKPKDIMIDIMIAYTWKERREKRQRDGFQINLEPVPCESADHEKKSDMGFQQKSKNLHFARTMYQR